MKAHRLAERLAVLIFLLGAITPRASAHRLDEYLQAARITIEPPRVQIALDLTPGAAVAGGIFESIDVDHDGKMSVKERDDYAQAVMTSLSLAVDGRSYVLKIDDLRFPTLEEMRLGEGVIRLRAHALVPGTREGRHGLMFSNHHRSDIGAYLVNALMPEDGRIHITGQSRDMLQREFALEYSVSAGENQAAFGALPILLSAAMAATLFALVRRNW
jgi:hypothetical protein